MTVSQLDEPGRYLPVLASSWWRAQQRLRPITAEVRAERVRQDAAVERIRAGASTVFDEFGPALDIDRMRAKMDARWPGMPARYRLPKGWHWMGDHDDSAWRRAFAALERRADP